MHGNEFLCFPDARDVFFNKLIVDAFLAIRISFGPKRMFYVHLKNGTNTFSLTIPENSQGNETTFTFRDADSPIADYRLDFSLVAVMW